MAQAKEMAARAAAAAASWQRVAEQMALQMLRPQEAQGCPLPECAEPRAVAQSCRPDRPLAQTALGAPAAAGAAGCLQPGQSCLPNHWQGLNRPAPAPAPVAGTEVQQAPRQLQQAPPLPRLLLPAAVQPGPQPASACAAATAGCRRPTSSASHQACRTSSSRSRHTRSPAAVRVPMWGLPVCGQPQGAEHCSYRCIPRQLTFCHHTPS